KIIERGGDAVLGIFRARAAGGGRIEPVEKRRRDTLPVAPGDAGAASDGDLVTAELVSRDRLGPPMARVREVVGPASGERAVSMIAIHQHELPHVFPEEVLAEAAKARRVSVKGRQDWGRQDWRDLPLITIDPADAKDHDDAVHASRDDD